ncbi:hypothetical protein DFH94DRAFT_711212 [Russula ochroleuca]|uniref:Uncharacterized protein n=1 Tax=Russula ochroleuca TaxID=152965 RepID=A0A9P5N4B6_9AGAM|nr:hypothetical protein DFH94DRAFT_711212 [Russula ochroleuca]
MNIQPFTNSHSLYEQQTVSVDRATVFPQSTRPVVDDDKLTQLDELLRANVGDLDVPSTRKRRKHISSGKGQSTLQETLDPAPFRLVSIANAPKIISLQPKPLPVRAVWEPPCEDNDREVELRKQQALSAAVDVPSLLKSAQAYISRPQKAEKIIRASALESLSYPPFFLAEIPRSKSVPLRVSHDRVTRPSPHEVKQKGDALRVISLRLHGGEQPVARPKRNHKRRTVENPPATFWRPLRRWGGKSSGYAMGYEGSWPVEDDHEPRYVRDRMRKGVHVIQASI